MAVLRRHALGPPRLVADEKRRQAPLRPFREREHPPDRVAVGTRAHRGCRIRHRDSGASEGPRVGGKVVGLETIVHEPAAALERRPPAVRRIRLVEGDQLEVGSVGERDQGVVSAGRVAAARHDGEPERRVVAHRRSQIADADDQMIHAEEHQARILRRSAFSAWR